MLLHLENFELQNRSKIQIPIGNAKKIVMPLIPMKPQFNRIQSIIIGFFLLKGGVYWIINRSNRCWLWQSIFVFVGNFHMVFMFGCDWIMLITHCSCDFKQCAPRFIAFNSNQLRVSQEICFEITICRVNHNAAPQRYQSSWYAA